MKYGHPDLLSSTLHLDVQKILRDSLHYNKPDIAARTSLYWQQVNFSSLRGKKADYLVKANFQPEWWKDNTTLIFAFLRSDTAYKLSFYWEGGGKSYNHKPRLLDIDSDTRMEILMESDLSGNQGTATQVDIWRFDGKQFQLVFSQGLSEGYTSCPYGTENKYSFTKNQRNPKLLNIRFIVDTDTASVNPELLSHIDPSEKTPKLPPPFHATYLFRFDGTRYVSDKPVYDYRKYFRQLYGDGFH
jgi:hypothetical protein